MKNPLATQENDCRLEFACIGCNRTTQALSWGKCGLVAFAACNSVAIYKPKIKNSAGKLLYLLNAHRARVNCVQWLKSEDEDNLEIISGSSDNTIIVWVRKNEKWLKKQTLSGHTKMICTIASIIRSTHEGEGENAFMVSGSTDFSLKLWNRLDSSDFQCLHTLTFGNGFVHTVALAQLPHSSDILLACGCDDCLIRLYLLQENQLQLVLVLKGHKDCIRCLDFTKTASGNEILLASGSQDSYIRLWKICPHIKKEEDMLSLQEQSFVAGGEKYSVVLESVLISHEGWVFGVSWSSSVKPWPSLLSASMDRTIIVWEYDEENQVWIDAARMGEVGGNTLGYYGCAFGPDDTNLIAHGYQGAFQMWRREISETSNKWNPDVTISGHFGEVEDFDWDPDGEFVVTASTDQTTRLFAQWKRDDCQSTWHEIARPQIHGYDMKSVVMMGRYKYASGAQEKVVRIFAAPQSFYNSFSCISCDESSEKVVDLPLGATVPVLGLSNKAVFKDDIQSWTKPDEDVSHAKKSPFVDEPALFNPALIDEPPTEDVLLQNTLWPEIQKLYGHGFEIFSLASNTEGSVLASSCKASKPEYADILIWDAMNWKLVDRLNCHTLTVTQLCFSRSGQYLLSVSRDRTWALHKRSEDDHLKYTLVQKTEKSNSVHSRIIWACDWLSEDYFVTVSRDKKAIVWGLHECRWSPCKDAVNVGDAATAVSVSDSKTPSQRYIIAIGLESGAIHLYTWLNDDSESAWKLIKSVDRDLCPVLQIKRLRWRRKKIDNTWQLGVCSSDHSFRILKFNSSIFI